MTTPSFKILTGAAVLLACCLGRANVLNAPSGSFADVSSTVAQAQPGDTVNIPAGTNTWNTTLQLGGITLQGMGTNSTVIVDETPLNNNGLPLINVWTAATLTRVTGIQFVHGVTNNPFAGWPATGMGEISIGGSSPLFRIDHCFFNYLTGKDIHVNLGEWGLIDHCTFLNGWNNAIEVMGDSPNGDISWATPANFGGTNALYVENCYFYNGPPDLTAGGRMVFRYNVAECDSTNGFFISTHDTARGAWWRSVRFLEVYGNKFTYHPAGSSDNYGVGINFCGGSGIVFSNTLINYEGMANMVNNRVTDNDPDFGPWYGATGMSGWDLNSTNPADSWAGVASVAGSTLTVAGANWTNNQWIGYTVWNTNNIDIRNHGGWYTTNTGNIGFVISNNANTMFFKTSRSPDCQIQFQAGDTFLVNRVLAGIDFTGRGQGDLLPTYSPIAMWLHDTIEPLYFWNNSVSKNINGTPTPIAWVFGSEYPGLILEGRDFFNTPKPGYTPLVYPHPLATIGAPPSTNPPTITSPPQSQIVTNGSSLLIAVSATGDNLNYNWQFNNSPIAGATGNTYSIATAQPTDAGNYTVVITNPYGSVTSAAAVVTVTTPVAPPTVTPALTPPSGLNVVKQ
jgi:hypothetical protein